MVRVAVLGVGYWGPNLVRNLIENPLCSEVAICDLDVAALGKIARRYPGVRVTRPSTRGRSAPWAQGPVTTAASALWT